MTNNCFFDSWHPLEKGDTCHDDGGDRLVALAAVLPVHDVELGVCAEMEGGCAIPLTCCCFVLRNPFALQGDPSDLRLQIVVDIELRCLFPRILYIPNISNLNPSHSLLKLLSAQCNHRPDG